MVKTVSSGNNHVEDVEYHIQYILGRKLLTPNEWLEVCDAMNTSIIHRGSVLRQEDDEDSSQSTELQQVERFLIKWQHASYIHISWETELNLIRLVGNAAKSQIRKFRDREFDGIELFDDLSIGEYFPSSFVYVERVLNVIDKCKSDSEKDGEAIEAENKDSGNS